MDGALLNERQHAFVCSLVLEKQIHNWIAINSVKAGLCRSDFEHLSKGEKQPCALREKLCGDSVQPFPASVLALIFQARKNSWWKIPCKSGSHEERWVSDREQREHVLCVTKALSRPRNSISASANERVKKFRWLLVVLSIVGRDGVGENSIFLCAPFILGKLLFSK